MNNIQNRVTSVYQSLNRSETDANEDIQRHSQSSLKSSAEKNCRRTCRAAFTITLTTHREIFSKSYYIRPKSGCIYHATIDLEPNGCQFDVVNQSENCKYNLICKDQIMSLLCQRFVTISTVYFAWINCIQAEKNLSKHWHH